MTIAQADQILDRGDDSLPPPSPGDVNDKKG